MGAFKNVWWQVFDAPRCGDTLSDLFVVADNAAAKQTFFELTHGTPFRYIDAGNLKNARTIERMTLLSGEMGQRYGFFPRMNYKLLGDCANWSSIAAVQWQEDSDGETLYDAGLLPLLEAGGNILCRGVCGPGSECCRWARPIRAGIRGGIGKAAPLRWFPARVPCERPWTTYLHQYHGPRTASRSLWAQGLSTLARTGRVVDGPVRRGRKTSS